MRFILLVLALSVLAFAADPAVNLQPGKYEITTTVEMTMNGSSKTYPPQTTAHCLTADSLADPEQVFNERIVLAARYHPDTSCTQHGLKNTPTSVSYDEDCTNRSIHVEATLSSTSYTTIRRVVPKDPRAPQMTYNIAGKRTGECPR